MTYKKENSGITLMDNCSWGRQWTTSHSNNMVQCTVDHVSKKRKPSLSMFSSQFFFGGGGGGGGGRMTFTYILL